MAGLRASWVLGRGGRCLAAWTMVSLAPSGTCQACGGCGSCLLVQKPRASALPHAARPPLRPAEQVGPGLAVWPPLLLPAPCLQLGGSLSSRPPLPRVERGEGPHILPATPQVPTPHMAVRVNQRLPGSLGTLGLEWPGRGWVSERRPTAALGGPSPGPGCGSRGRAGAGRGTGSHHTSSSGPGLRKLFLQLCPALT